MIEILPSVSPGTEEMAQCLKALDAPPEDVGLIPNTHLAAHNQLDLQFQEFHILFQPLWFLGMYLGHRHTWTQNIHTHKDK